MVSASVLFSTLSVLAAPLLTASLAGSSTGLIIGASASPHQDGAFRTYEAAKRHSRHRSLAARSPTGGARHALRNQQEQKRQSPKKSGNKVCKIRGSNATSTVSSSAAASTTAASSTVISSVVTTASSSSSSSAWSASEAVPTPEWSSSSQAAVVQTKANYVASSSSSAAPAATTAASSTPAGGLTPNGKKAGIAGGDSYDWVKDHIGWWYDWSSSPSGHSGGPIAVPMIWGAGGVDQTDSARLDTFKSITTPPQYIIGYEEPDCFTPGSAGVDVGTAASLWNQYVVPLQQKGSIVLSPSMCHQAAETGWLQPFQQQISQDWDITNLHINKNSMAGVKEDLDHYWNTYGKPMWVTEFACVNDVNGFVPCTDQSEIDQYISDIVALFESDSRVYAYAYSDGLGLGSVWPSVSGGSLSASGQSYLNAISQH